MIILKTRKELLKWRASISPSKTIGFVPTMGALHAGHLSLVKKAQLQNDLVIVSIFVNPTQFGPKEDFKKYPRTEKEDLKLLNRAKINAVFMPRSPKEIYAQSDETKILPRANLTSMMEGKFRPGHFEGVATVVFKLFILVQPHSAYFGEKDYQQLCVIQAMVEDLFLPLEIVPCKTLREKSGLAMSSRNKYLVPALKEDASLFAKTLMTAKTPAAAKTQLQKAGFKVDYIEAWSGRWLGAVHLGNVRLIDNIERR